MKTKMLGAMVAIALGAVAGMVAYETYNQDNKVTSEYECKMGTVLGEPVNGKSGLIILSDYSYKVYGEYKYFEIYDGETLVAKSDPLVKTLIKGKTSYTSKQLEDDNTDNIEGSVYVLGETEDNDQVASVITKGDESKGIKDQLFAVSHCKKVK